MDMKNPREQRLLTPLEVAAYLAVNPRTVYRLLKEHHLPAFRVGGQWRFKLELIDAWIRRDQADQYRHRPKVMV